VFSCEPGGVSCKTLRHYSDHDLQEKNYGNNKVLYYFDINVLCGSIRVNAKELHLRFTSDGPVPKNPDVPASVVYTGFHAVYWTSSAPLTEEWVGCPPQNKTLTTTQGSIFAADTMQISSTAVSSQSGAKWLQHHGISLSNTSKYGTTLFKEEYVKRCVNKRGGECDNFGRQQSKWWIISPKESTSTKQQAARSPKSSSKSIVLAIRDLVLEDSLDVLSIYARTNTTVQKVKTISGLSPLKNHGALRCSKCQCKTKVGASGTITDKRTSKTFGIDCTWVINTREIGFKYLMINTASSVLKQPTAVAVETCMDQACGLVSERSYMRGDATSGVFMTRTGVARLFFAPASFGADENLKIDWKGLCRDPPVIFKETIGSFDDGWETAYLEYANCQWIIAPENADNLTVTFTDLALPGLKDHINIHDCNDKRCNLTNFVVTLNQTLNLTEGSNFTVVSGTGIMLVTLKTSGRAGMSAFAGGFKASWTSTSKAIEGDGKGRRHKVVVVPSRAVAPSGKSTSPRREQNSRRLIESIGVSIQS
jgi:hypothetical protein